MTAKLLSDEELVRRLEAHPQLRHRMESLLLAVEDEAGELREADAAELRVIDEMRRMGREALQAWAAGQVAKTGQEMAQQGGVWSEGKKTLLAHHPWRHQRRRAAISPGQSPDARLCPKRQSKAPGLLQAFAARGH
jgi:hypothetical protein